MIYLILAIVSSSLISIFMRLSENHIKNEMGMFMANYALCSVLAIAFMDEINVGSLLGTHDQHLTVIIGIITGAFFLGGFLFLKYNMKYNGIVLSSTFMKLGVLIPTIMAIIVFGEVPSILQVVGIAIAIVAIIIINFEKDAVAAGAVDEKSKTTINSLHISSIIKLSITDMITGIF